MSIIRDAGGNMIERIDGEHLHDEYGNWKGDISNNKICDTGGNYVGEFRGEPI